MTDVFVDPRYRPFPRGLGSAEMTHQQWRNERPNNILGIVYYLYCNYDNESASFLDTLYGLNVGLNKHNITLKKKNSILLVLFFLVYFAECSGRYLQHSFVNFNHGTKILFANLYLTFKVVLYFSCIYSPVISKCLLLIVIGVIVYVHSS